MYENSTNRGGCHTPWSKAVNNDRFLWVNTILLVISFLCIFISFVCILFLIITYFYFFLPVFDSSPTVSLKVLRCLASCYTSFTFLDFCCDHCPNFFFTFSVLVFISINHVSVTKFESPLDTDTQIISTLWHVPLVSVLTGFYCN